MDGRHSMQSAQVQQRRQQALPSGITGLASGNALLMKTILSK